MRLPLLALLTALMLVTGCAKVRALKVNPFNWFQAPVATTLEPKEGYLVTTDNRALVDQVLSLVVEPNPGGAIVRATGLPPTQGYWRAALVAENDGDPVDGVLTYRFVIFPPPGPAAVSSQQSREITAAAYLTTNDLAKISRINVQGLRSVQSVSR